MKWRLLKQIVVVERAAGKGVDEAGPERSGGVQLAGTTKQRKKKECGCRQGLRTTR